MVPFTAAQDIAAALKSTCNKMSTAAVGLQKDRKRYCNSWPPQCFHYSSAPFDAKKSTAIVEKRAFIVCASPNHQPWRHQGAFLAKLQYTQAVGNAHELVWAQDKQDTLEYSCRALLLGTLAGHSCGTLLWDTLVRHFCGTLFWQALVGHSCGTLL